MFIDRSFSDITSSWKWDFEGPKPGKQCWKKENPDADFFDFVSINVSDRKLTRIIRNRIFIPGYDNSEGFYYREKCHNVSDFRNIMKGKFFEKKSCCEEGESGIF